jgi:hypothetical protein
MGKDSERFKRLRNDVATLVQRLAGDKCSQPSMTADKANGVIRVSVSGDAKPFISLIVGRVQSALLELAGTGGSHLPVLVLYAPGSEGQAMMKNQRIVQLSTTVVPSTFQTRDQAMLLVAHTMLWCGAAFSMAALFVTGSSAASRPTT